MLFLHAVLMGALAPFALGFPGSLSSARRDADSIYWTLRKIHRCKLFSDPAPRVAQHERKKNFSLSRRCTDSGNPATLAVNTTANTVTINMEIDDGVSASYDNCTIEVSAPSGSDPKTLSWAVQPCDVGGWFLSWGYNGAKDSAVCTLIK